MLLGNEDEGDIDIATNATPTTISSLFSHVIPVGEHFGVMLVVQQGIPFEVATFRSDVGIGDGRHPEAVVFTDAQTDAQRRDFSINGLFFDPLSEELFDYVGGKADLEAGIIRAIGEPRLRFEEDYLRLLRGIRFAARFDFAIEPQTWEALCAQSAGIKAISAERIFQELNKMLLGPRPHRAIELLKTSGLLPHILPTVAQMDGVEQPVEYHPEGDVLEHTLLALSLLPPQRSLALAWGALLHDIGKPPTMTRTDRIRFNNHHHVGAEMAHGLLRKLRAPNELVGSVCAIIENHMNFMNVTQMRRSTLKRFLSRPTLADEMELHRADCLASHGDISNIDFLQEQLTTFVDEQLKPPALLSGKDLIGLGFKPGPLFGQILEDVYEQQLEECISTRQEALEWVEQKYSHLRPPSNTTP